MQLLAKSGFTYNVYDLGNGRVLKKEKPLLWRACMWLRFGYAPRPIGPLRQNVLRVMDSRIDKQLLGNPLLVHRADYTQDKLQIMSEYLSTHSFVENTKSVDAYVELIFATWRAGFSDIIFNFSHNCGITSSGTVVLVDFNEVTFAKEVVAERIRIVRWEKSYSFRVLPNGPLKEYYQKTMAEKITLANLERYWQSYE